MNKNNLLIILLLPLFSSCGKQAAVQKEAADGLMLTDSLQHRHRPENRIKQRTAIERTRNF